MSVGVCAGVRVSSLDPCISCTPAIDTLPSLHIWILLNVCSTTFWLAHAHPLILDGVSPLTCGCGRMRWCLRTWVLVHICSPTHSLAHTHALTQQIWQNALVPAWLYKLELLRGGSVSLSGMERNILRVYFGWEFINMFLGGVMASSLLR